MKITKPFSTPYPLWEENVPFSKENTPFLGKQSFHKRDTIFNSFFNYCCFFFLQCGGGGGGGSGLLREAFSHKIR